MKPKFPKRTRQELATLAAAAASKAGRLTPGATRVSIRHDDDCPMLKGKRHCRCDVEFVIHRRWVR